MNIYLDANTLRKARKLQANMYESNGRIAFDDEGNVWMTHPKRKCFSSIVFSPEPGKCSGNDFNMFQGLRITSNISRDVVHASSVDYKEYIKPILTHLRTVWCDDDEHTYE